MEGRLNMKKSLVMRQLWLIVATFLLGILSGLPQVSVASTAIVYDVVILNGRVMDPESKLDALRNIGITGGRIAAISAKALNGRATIDARGLIVSPGFIDLHVHDMNAEHHRAQVLDGVTTALDLEVATADIDRWYAEREGRTLINYGVSIGHIPVRMSVMRDPGTFVPTGDAAHRAASKEEIAEFKRRLEKGLQRGAVAVGFGINYTAAASHLEILEMFRVAARFAASCHVHLRYGGIKEPMNSIRALEEVIAVAAITGAPVHVVHITSMGLGDTPVLLEMVSDARSRGMDITTECYPYTAGMTGIESAIFDEGWKEKMAIDYQDLQWAATGERLTAESFARYRKTGGMIAVHSIPENVVKMALAHSLPMIASDGILQNGKGHPRASGTYSRVLGRYVRQEKVLTLMDAVRKMTLMPAQRLEKRVPTMKNKGRIRLGADADLTIFDAGRIIDRATFEEPGKFSEGIQYVLVNGVLVVKDGQLRSDAYPGRAVRAPIQ
jgi:N-acyl-D-aspartate/D-glutamate deacylase